MTDDGSTRPTLASEQAQRELVRIVSSLESLSPVDRAHVLAYLRSVAAELVLRLDWAAGLLLLSWPDLGGRPKLCDRLSTARAVRVVLGVDRDAALMLRRFAQSHDAAAIERLVDAAWDGTWPRIVQGASVVRAKPPSSASEGE